MAENSYCDQTFENINYSTDGFPKGEFENCTFVNCVLSEVNLSHCVFMECIFRDCDLSGVILGDTAFKDVSFESSKLLGVDFAHCNTFLLEMYFEGCNLNLASFYQLPLRKTVFNKCSMEEVDLVQAVLTEAKFKECNLARAQFEQTNLEKADLRSAYNYAIDPSHNNVKKAMFSKEGIAGLLAAFQVIVE